MSPTPASRTFTAEIVREGDSGGAGIELPFDPKDVFGKARAPVTATLRGYSYRTTTFFMSGRRFIPLAKKHMDGAGVSPGDRVRIKLTADEKPREIEPPADLLRAVRKLKGGRAAWDALSYTHKREHAEAIKSAKKPETRERRIAKAVEMLKARIDAKP